MDWMGALNQIFQLIIPPAMLALTAVLISFIHGKTKETKDRTNNETAHKYIDMLDKTIVDCVLATNQTYVEALKKAGSFDIEAQKQAFKLTYDAVMAILTDDAQSYLNEAIKDLNAYITNKIESQVVVAKQQPIQ